MAEGSLWLAREGKPVAEIVVPKGADQVVVLAGAELQKWVKAISGAELPIVDSPTNAENALVLAVRPNGFPNDLAALEGTDGYAVRTNGKTVTLLAACPKGVLNGVYRTL